MAIIYSYPLNQPKRDDLLIGTITYDENAVNPVHGNPTVSFTIGSLLDLVSGQGNAQNLQQVTNIGNTTTNSIVISNNLLVSGGYYDSSNQPGTAGQLLSSTATGTQWVNVSAQGVTSVGLSMPAAFTVANSPITQAGILAVTGAGTAAQYIDGTGALQTFTSYEKWILAGDAGVQDITAGQTASILGGTDIATVVTSPRTLTINHSAVTRSNTTATASPNPGDTVDLVSLVSSSATGHITGVETTTVTWPTNQNTTYTIDVPATTTSINLKGSDSTDDPIALVGGTNITITRDSDSSLTWDSLNTEYTAGIGLTLNTLEFDVNVDATAGNAPEGLSTDASRTYAIQLDNNSTNLVVNVPWDDTIQTITGTGTNNTNSGILLSDSGGTVLILGDGSVTAAQTGNTITLTGTDTGITGVTLATADSTGSPLSESITTRELTLTSAKYVGGANVGYVPEGGTGTTYLKGDGTWAAIPTGLQFKGTWDASGGGGGSPDLTLAANKGAGFLWICDVAGTAYPNGGTNEPSTWNLGDWCVYDGSAWTRVPATNSGVTSVTTTDGTYIDLTPDAATTGAITVTADLNATGTQDATTFLRGDNTWGVPSYTVDTTYTIDVPSATTSINLKGSDGTDDAIVLTGGTNVTLSRTDDSTIDIAATNTTYTAGNGLNLSGTVFSADINNTQADAATQALDASPPANRFYAVQLDNNATVADADLVVNIPWTDTQNPNQTLLGAGSDNTNSGIILNESGGTVLILGATGIAASQATNTVTLTGTTYGINFEPNAGASPQINPFLRLTGTGTASGTTDLEIVGTGATTVTRNNDNKITINSAAGSYSWKVRDSSDVDGTVLNSEYLQFVTATGALATDLTGTGTNTDPYVMTLTSPDEDTTYVLAGAADSSVAANYNLVLSADGTTQDTMVFKQGSDITFTRAANSLTIAAANDDTLYDLAGAASTTAGEYNLVLSADSTAQDTMVFKQGSNITFTRAADLLTITATNTWIANAVTVAGYVAAPAATDANLVWKTNASGEPAWRADATGDNNTYTITSTGKVITLNDTSTSTAAGTITFVDGNDITVSSAADNTITIASTFTEADTLATVTARGATTSVASTFSGGLTASPATNNTPAVTTNSAIGSIISLGRNALPTNGNRLGKFEFKGYSSGGGSPVVSATITASANIDWVNANNYDSQIIFQTTVGIALRTALVSKPGLLNVWGTGSSGGDAKLVLNCYNNNHGQTLSAQPHSEGITNTMLLPKGADSTLVSEATETFQSLTTTGTSGASTLSAAGVLNIPEYENTQENTEWYVRDSGDDDKTVNNEKYLKFVTATGSLGTALTGTGSTSDPYLMTLTSPDTNTQLGVATTTTLGGIELGSDTALTTTYVTGTAGSTTRSYPVQLNAERQAAVYVPWTDNQNPNQTLLGTGSDNSDSGIILNESGGTVLVLGAGSITAAQASNTITLTSAANSKTVAGYVTAPGAVANKVWKTDASGNPGWRADADSGVSKIIASTNITISPVTGLGDVTISATDTNTTYSSGNGITFTGTPATTINADINYISYSGNNNFIIYGTQNDQGTTIPTGSQIAYADPSGTQIVSRGLISDLPFSNNSGTVTGTGTSGVVAKWNTAGTGLIDSGLSFPPSTTYANFVLGASGGTTVQFVGNASQTGDFSIKNTTGAIILQPNNVAIASRVASFSTTDIRLNESTIVSGTYLQTVDNTATPLGNLYVGSKITTGDTLNGFRINSVSGGLYFDVRNTGDQIIYRDYDGASVNDRFKMDMSAGTFTASGDLIAYGSPSDKRLKENIKPIESALDKAMKLQGVTFDWKQNDNILSIKQDIGFIAQDVKEVIPELVRENEDGMLSMRHQGIAPILLEAIKELKAEIEELKCKSCNCK